MIKSKSFFNITIAFMAIYLINMIGSSFSLNEGLLDFHNLDELINSETNILHVLFTTFFRTSMPITLLLAFCFIDKDFLKNKNLPLVLFLVSTVLLIINNMIIYGFGVYIFIAIKNLISIEALAEKNTLIDYFVPTFELISVLINDVMSLIFSPVLEFVRGFAIVFILKSYKFNKGLLYLAAAFLIFDFFVLCISFLSFLGFEVPMLGDIDFGQCANVAFPYWVFFVLCYLIYGAWKKKESEASQN